MLAVTASVHGPTAVTEGAPYSLNLNATSSHSGGVTSWFIDWGDGSDPDNNGTIGEIIPGNPSTAQHTYIDGDASRYIRATATDADGTVAAQRPIHDSAFGASGKTATEFPASVASALWTAIQPDGKTLALGEIRTAAGYRDLALVRYHADGSPDATFGDQGRVIYAGPAAHEYSGGVAVQADGKIVIAGTGFVATGAYNTYFVRYNSDGTLDAAFGTAGVATFDLGGYDSPSGILIDGSNRIVAAVSTNTEGTGSQLGLIRLTTSGALDSSFGTDGKAIVNLSGTSDAARTLLFQGDKIVLAGRMVNGSNSTDFVLMRFTASGELDSTFGTAGITTTQIYYGDDPAGAVFDDQGRIIVIGTSGERVSMARYSADGILDATFGTNGTRTNDLTTGYDYATSARVQTVAGGGSKIVVAGYTLTVGGSTSDFVVSRFTLDGDLDTSFGTNGKTVTSIEHADVASSMLMAGDGKFVVAGRALSSSGQNFELARYSASGSLDTSFGNAGRVSTAFDSDTGSSDDLVVDAQGRVIVVGTMLGSWGTDDVVLARYNANGSLDGSFGTGGRVRINLGITINDYGNDVLIDGQGRILVGASTGIGGSMQFAVFRLTSTGQLDTTFGSGGSGYVTVDVGTNTNDSVAAMATDTSGRIILGGFTTSGGGGNNFAVVRLDADGNVDTTFGINGRVVRDVAGGDDRIVEILVQADGKIVAVGTSPSGGGRGTVLRLHADGTTDVTYGNAGLITLGTSETANVYTINAATLDAQGRVLLAGIGNFLAPGVGWQNDLAVVRLTTAGGIDTSFGTSGVARVGQGSHAETATAIRVDGEGRILLAGVRQPGLWLTDYNAVGNDLLLSRLTPTGQLDSTFGNGGIHTVDFGGKTDVATAISLEQPGRSFFVAGRSRGTKNNDTFTLLKLRDPSAIQVEVTNAAPALTLSGDGEAELGQPYALTITATDPGDDTITSYLIDWGDGSDPDNDGNIGQIVTSIAAPIEHTYAATGAYTIHLAATDEDGTYYAPTLDVSVDAPPSAPLNLNVVSGGIAAMSLSWDAPGGSPDGYVIQRRVDGGDWEEIDTVYGNSLSYTDFAFVMNASLDYRVSAFNGVDIGSSSNVATFVTGSGGLSTPDAVAASVRGTSGAIVTWSDTSVAESGFLIEVDSGGGFVELGRTLAGGTTYFATGLADGTTYAFRVSAFAAYGTSEGSTSNDITTELAPPSLVAAQVGDHAVTLTWNDESSSETYYKIQYSEDGSSWVDVDNASANATQSLIDELEYGKTYFFHVRSANAQTQSGWVGLADVEVKAPRAAPFTATAVTARKVALGLDIETPGLEVQRSFDGMTGWETVTLEELAPEGSSQYGAKNLAPETVYYFKSRHDTDYGMTDWSVPVSTKTLSLTPPNLDIDLYYGSTDGLSVWWQQEISEESGFRLEISSDGVSYETLATVGADENEFARYPSGLEPESTYYFRAFTLSDEFESAPSSVVTLRTEPAAPENLVATSPNPSEINLTWDDMTSGEDWYEIHWSEVSVTSTFQHHGVLYGGPNTQGLTLTGLQRDTEYSFEVFAFRSGENAARGGSAFASTRTLPNPDPNLNGYSSTLEILNVQDGSLRHYFAEGADIPAGTYTVSFVEGTMYVPPYGDNSWTLSHSDGQVELPAPSITATPAESVTFAHAGGTIALFLTGQTGHFNDKNRSDGLLWRIDTLPQMPYVSVTAVDSNAQEPPSDPADSTEGIAMFRVSRTGDTTSALNVLVHPPAGTAILGVDYTLNPDGSASVTIAENEAYVDIVLIPIDDSVADDGETAVLHLKGAAHYRLVIPHPEEYPGAGATIHDASLVDVDLDTDSDNSDGLQRTLIEDEVEDVAGDPAKPGKILRPNVDDGDLDNVPAFADGFNFDGSVEELPDNPWDNADFSTSMADMVLSLPPGIRLADASLTINYSASNPSEITVSGDGPFIYTLPGDGVARIWTGPYNNRVLAPLSSRVIQNGTISDTRHFFVESKTYSGEELRKLGFTTNQDGIINNSITLFVEGVKPSIAPGDVRVEATLTAAEFSEPLSDAVRFTFTKFDLDIDSDNTSTDANGIPERTNAEEEVEEDLNKPGKVIVANTADKDADGLPDLADGFNGLTDNNHDDASVGEFVPVVFELPDVFDPEHAELTITYSASDPDPALTRWLGNQFSQAYKAADGHLRLWTKDAGEARSWKDLRAEEPGQFVGAGKYSGEALSRLMALRNSSGVIKLYVEGIRATDAASGAIQVSLKMSAADYAPTFTDQVRVTVVNAVTPEARDSLISTADGSFRYESRDFDLPGWTENFGHGLLFTNAPEYVKAVGAQMFASTTDWPRLVNAGSTMMVLIGGQSFFFDRVGGEWKSRFGLRHKLVQEGENAAQQFKFVTAQGETWIFNGFGESLKEARRGSFKQYISIGGQTVTAGEPDADGRISRITRGGVTIDYAYKTADPSKGELETITAKRGGTTLYTVTYTYYGENDFYGNTHDVKTVEIKMGTNVVERKRFFYAKNGTERRSMLIAAIEGRNYARAKNAGLDPAVADTVEQFGTLSDYLDFLNNGSIYTPATSTISLAGGLNPDGGVGNNAWTNWQVQTVGNLVTTIFSNAFGQPLVVAAKDAVTKYTKLTSYRYDSKNNLIQEASPAAVATYDQSKPDLVGYTSETAAKHLRDDAGLITRYVRNADGLVESEYIRNGDLGTDIQLRSFTYVPIGADSVQQVATVTDYVTEGANPTTRTTAYNYQNPAHNLPTKIITTRADGEFITKDYNAFGRLEYVTDADGYIHHTAWDNEKGVATSQVTDDGGLNITTQITATDAWGRVTASQDAIGHQSSFEYSDGLESSLVTVTLPDGRKLETTSNWQDGFTQTLTKTGSGTILNAQREHVDYAGRTIHSDRYFRIPAGNPTALTWGSASTNSNDGDFHRASFTYDATGQLIRTTDGIGTNRETKYDAFGRATDQLVNGALTHKFYYFDLGVTGTTATVTQAFANGTAAPRATRDYFDWRGRKVASEDGVQLTWITYSNLDEVLAIDVFDQSKNRVNGVISGVGIPRRLYEDAGRLSRTKFGHDSLGRTWTTEVASVDASDGTFGAGLITMAEYDGRGNVVRATSQSGLTTETTTDGAGRQVDVIQKVGQLELARAHQEFDANGNVLLSVRTDNGPAGVRRSYVRTEYDEMGRPTASVDFGTNGGSAVSATMALPERVFADGRNAFLRTDWSYDYAGEVEVMTDARGVQTKNEYDALGRTTKTIGNFTAGAASDYTDSVQTFEYNGTDQVTVTKTSVPGGGFSRSERFYDARGRLATILYPAAVPGTSGGLGNVETYTYNNLDEVISKKERSDVTHTYTLNTRGLVERDQVSFPANTPIDKGLKAIVTQYDALGRIVGTKNQGSRGGAIKREYNELGQLLREWQDVDGDVDGATPVIQYHYGPVAEGSLLTGITYPSGRHISYGYANSEDGAVGRPTTISDSAIGGVVEQYEYLGLQQVIARSRPEANASQAFYGKQGAIDLAGDAYTGLDRFGRVVDYGWELNGTYADRFQYEYDAGSNVLSKNNLVNPAFGELFHRGEDVADASGGNPANIAYDHFGRLEYWMRGQLSTSGSSARLNDVDGESVLRKQYWVYDHGGNWKQFYDGRKKHVTAFDSRQLAINPTQGDGESGENPTASAYQYNDAGTLVRSTNGISRGVTYDAWGRAVTTKVYNGDKLQGSSTYYYDPLGRPVLETSTSQWSDGQTFQAGYSEMYYDQSGHMIEEVHGRFPRESGAWRRDSYVWGVDGKLVSMEQGPTPTNPDKLRFSVFDDGMGNTTSIAVKGVNDPSYALAERYVYDPHGQAMVLTSGWTDRDLVASTVLYDNNPLNPSNYSKLGFRYLFGQQRWFQADRLYHSVGGTYDPILTMSAQPSSTIGTFKIDDLWGRSLVGNNMLGRSIDTNTALLGGYGSDIAAASWSHAWEQAKGVDWAAVGHTALDAIGVVDPFGIADGINGVWYLSEGDYLNAAISFIGLIPYAGDVAKVGRLGKTAARTMNGLDTAKSGVSLAMHSVQPIAKVAKMGPKIGGHAMGCTLLSMGVNATVGGTISFASAAGGSYISSGNIDWSLATRAGLVGAGEGLLSGARNPYICFVAGTQVVVAVEEDGNARGDASAEHAEGSTATATRVRYKTVAIETLVARGGGEMGDGGGQVVLTRDQHDPTGPLVRRRITRTYRRTAYALQILTVRDENGVEQTLKVTEEHPFYRQSDGWTPARKLDTGDIILGADGTLTVVANKAEQHPGGVTVYNLEVEQAHTYFVLAEHANDAAAVWVHNATYDVDANGLTLRAEARITGSHRGRGKGYRPEPSGGRIPGDHRGHLIPEGGVDNPALVNVRENMIAEAAASNLGPKKRIENFAIRLADEHPNSVVSMVVSPQRRLGQVRPFATTVLVHQDGRLVNGLSIFNR